MRRNVKKLLRKPPKVLDLEGERYVKPFEKEPEVAWLEDRKAEEPANGNASGSSKRWPKMFSGKAKQSELVAVPGEPEA